MSDRNLSDIGNESRSKPERSPTQGTSEITKTQVTIDIVFIVADSMVAADISTWAKHLTKHTRRRRDFSFGETEDTESSKCAEGQGVSSDGESCSELFALYSSAQ